MREKLVKIGAKIVDHAGYVTFQMAEVLVSKAVFNEGLSLKTPKKRPQKREILIVQVAFVKIISIERIE